MIRTKTVSLITIGLGAFCLLFVFRGIQKATLMAQIDEAGMYLLSTSTGTNDFEAKLYESAYASPIAPEKAGLWLEAILARDFETFSTKGIDLSPEFARKLKGWPISRAVELDFSGSELSISSLTELGEFNSAEWINLSQTRVDAEAIELLLKRAPNLKRLQLEQTTLIWSDSLVDRLIAHSNLEEVVLDPMTLPPEHHKCLPASLKVHQAPLQRNADKNF